MPPLFDPAPRLRFAGLGLTLAGCLAWTGCNQDEIRTYKVPPLPSGGIAAADAASNDSAAPQTPTHRMLAAIIQGPSQAWFFKVVGEIDQVDSVSDGWASLLESIAIDTESGQPTWKLPDGWTDRGASGMRLATIDAPLDSGSLELSVIGLPKSGDWDSQVLDNLNRWRGQMKLPPITAGQLAAETTRVAAAPEGSVAMSLEGVFSDGGMSGGGMAAPFANRPPMTPRAMTPPPGPPAQGSEITHTPPADWVAGPPSSMRVASLLTSSDPDAAVAKISKFAAAGAMGDTLTNLNRWRGQVGLPPLDAASLDQEAEAVTIGGVEGQLAEMAGPERSIVAAMAERDGQVWFFLLDGKPGVVADNTQAFRAWLDSVQFAEDTEPGEDK